MDSINIYQEQVLYHYILGDQIYLQAAESDYFSNQILKDSFEIAKEHALKYKESPSKEQFLQIVKIKGLSEKISDDVVTALYNTKQLLEQYDDQWLKDTVGAWIQTRKIETVLRKVIAYIKTTKSSVENAGDIAEKVRHMISTETVVNFNFKLSSDFFDPATHLQTRLARTTTGYEFIDLCLKGGYWKGSFIMFMGGPKSGKSSWLCNLAAKSVMNGYNTAYATLELQTEIVNMRIGANLLNIPVDDYENLVKDQDLLKKKLNNLKNSAFILPGQLRIQEFPTSTLSVNDLEAWLIKEQEILGIKFDNVFVDYLNIMKNWRNPNSENLYMKIKQISEDLRAMAMRNNWCVISVTQTNRGGINNTNPTLTDVSESTALLHTVDVLFGIVTDPVMKSNGEYFLVCLADRVAGYENIKKRFTIDWKHARIEEDMNTQMQDMDFFINTLHNNNKSRGLKSTQSSISAVIGSNPDPDKIVSNVNVSGQGLF
jgi:KaiC/GvpD/RAD55 family RecA-like ATPase